MKWFRFYSEATRDPKIRLIARIQKTSVAEIIGIWSILLSFANDSPERGKLLIARGVPVTEEDIEDVAGCNVSETLRNMLHVGMLKQDNRTYTIPNWEKRQFQSDNSTTRVRKYREKQAAETLQKRFGNAPDTDTDTDTDINKGTPQKSPPNNTKTTASHSPKKEQYSRPIQVFLENGGKFPTGKLKNGMTRKDRAIAWIEERVRDSPESLELWAKVVEGYCAQWSPKSYTVMVNDYYLTGRVPGEPKKPHGSNSNYGISAFGGGSVEKARDPTPEEIAEWKEWERQLAQAQAEATG